MKRVVVLLAVCLAGLPCAGQGAPSVSSLLAQLTSKSVVERVDGFERLKEMPDALKLPEVQAAMVNLLTLEGAVTHEINMKGQGTDEVYGEAYSEYRSELAGVVMDHAAVTPSPAAIRALAHCGYAPDSQIAKFLAEQGQAAVPEVLALAQDPLSNSRTEAVGIAARMIVLDKTAPQHMDPALRSRLKGVVSLGLLDKAVDVHLQAIKGLGDIGDATDADALDIVAARETNPYIHSEAVKAAAKCRKAGGGG